MKLIAPKCIRFELSEEAERELYGARKAPLSSCVSRKKVMKEFLE